MRTVFGFRRALVLLVLAVGLLAASPAASQLTAPENLAATPVHGQRIDLSWNPSAGSPQGYRVARQCASGDAEGYCTVAVLADPAAQSYQDVGVEASTAVHYRVEAYSGAASEAAFVSATTLSPTSLPIEPNPDSIYPLYFEPQGAWSLGAAVPLSGIGEVHLVHNLAAKTDLRILLADKEADDPENPCRQHSLVGRLDVAGYMPIIEAEALYTGSPAANTAEVYFHDLSRAVVGSAPLPSAIDSFDRMGDEGYVLVAESIGADGDPLRLRIVVAAHSPKGLFRGGMTVQRLLVDDTLCAARASLEPVVVLDYPDHPYRAGKSKTKMSSNDTSVPGQDLDLLDSLARSGATVVGWGGAGAVQEEWSWNHTGAKAEAAFKIAAAERFMEVKHWLGTSGIIFGTRKDDPSGDAFRSLSQVPYGDGLAVFEEPFSWIQTSPGSWQALSERQGTLHTRDANMLVAAPGSPWVPETCSAGTWSHDTAEGRAGSGPASFRLDGPGSDCGLVQSLDVIDAFAPGRYFLSAWVKASSNAANLSGELVLEVTTATGPTEFQVDFPPRLSGGDWTQLTANIDPGEVVTQASLAVRASMDAGTLWVDDFTLHEWGRPSFPFGSFPDSNGWSLTTGAGAFQFDSSKGHLDSASLKMVTPMEMDGEIAHLATRYHEMRFEEGRYVLGAWIKAERLVLPELPPEEDQDGDGLSDDVEIWLGLDPADPDMDGDGYDDGVEAVAGSSALDPDSVPSDSLQTHVDINLYFFDEVVTGSGPTEIRYEELRIPEPTNVKFADWYYHAHVFDISAEEAAKVKSVRLQVRAAESAAPHGAYWIDDVQVRRLDGDLRNLLGALQPPILRGGSGATYVEGEDYEVCQVGTTETECSPPLNYTETSEGGLTSSYNEDRPPFEIRWLRLVEPAEKRLAVSYDLGAQYSRVSKAGVGWDGTVFTRGSLNFCDVDGVVSGIELDAVFDRLMNNYTLVDFAPNGGEDYVLNADLVTWSVSEVRGINRSLACLDDQGEPALSNAALFANLVNRAFNMAKARAEAIPDSDFRFVMWDDMFNPFDNGGDPNYQLKYGGVTGRSACSYAPHQLGELCADEVAEVAAEKFVPILENEGLIMEPWAYLPNGIRRMVAISSWYEELGVTSHVLPADKLVNIDDWAGIAHVFGNIEGVHATNFDIPEGEGGEPGTLPGLQAFWNHDWKLLYLHDNETPESSFYQIPWAFEPVLTLENAAADVSGAYATLTEKFAGNNDGGIRFAETGTPKVSLDGVPVQGGRRYRVGVLAQRHSAYRSSGQTQDVPAPWISVLWSNGESTGPLLSERVYDTTTVDYPDWFDRYRVEVEAPEDATAMTVEIEFGAGGEIVAADDIVIFESIPPCFEACSLDLFSQDSDGDGLSDGWETQHGFNPNVAGEAALDPDLDGLNNLQEQSAGTDPSNADSDGDGSSDGEEVAVGTDPLDADSMPAAVPALPVWALAVLALLLLSLGAFSQRARPA